MQLLNHSWLVAVTHTTQHPEVVQSYIDMYVCTTEFPQNGFTKQQLVAGLSLDCCAWLTSSQTNLHSSDANSDKTRLARFALNSFPDVRFYYHPLQGTRAMFDCCTHNGHHYLDYARQLHMLFMFYGAWRTVYTFNMTSVDSMFRELLHIPITYKQCL